MIGAALYLTVIALFSLGLGAIIRNTAGGIAAFAAILFVIPPLMNVLPTSWNNAARSTCRATPAARSSRSRRTRTVSRRGSASGCSAAIRAGIVAVAAILLVRRDT